MWSALRDKKQAVPRIFPSLCWARRHQQKGAETTIPIKREDSSCYFNVQITASDKCRLAAMPTSGLKEPTSTRAFYYQ
jgi:hypothetical protein